jgi:hypothetical protein
MADCRIPFPKCDWPINQAADFVRSFQKLQTRGGSPVDLTGYHPELWVQPNDPAGVAFVVSDNGSSAPGTSATLDPTQGRIDIFISEAAVIALKLQAGALARFDLVDPSTQRLAQFHAVLVWDEKYRARK